MTTGRKPREEFPARDGWQRASGGLALAKLLERDFELVEISARRVVSLDHIGIRLDDALAGEDGLTQFLRNRIAISFRNQRDSRSHGSTRPRKKTR